MSKAKGSCIAVIGSETDNDRKMYEFRLPQRINVFMRAI